MSSKHTPGPWHVQKLQPHQDFFEVHHGQNAKGAASLVIARVTCRESWYEEQEANARLIAAAPELLTALQDAALWVDGDLKTKVYAAIAKATGEPT